MLLISDDISWLEKALVLQRLMQAVKSLEFPGHRKKTLVKQVFTVLVERHGSLRDEEKTLLVQWIASDGDALIDQFVAMAPNLFKPRKLCNKLGSCLSSVSGGR
jgi:hypothetical protein